MELLQPLADANRVRGREAAVHLDAEVHVRPDRLAHGADIGDGDLGRLRSMKSPACRTDPT